MCACITESLCCTPEANTLLVNYTSKKKKVLTHIHNADGILPAGKCNLIN